MARRQAHLRVRNPKTHRAWPLNPRTGRLWCTVNERDGLGDNLVPDYITSVRGGAAFYGWPWWYMGPHQDPRHVGKHPELRKRVIAPRRVAAAATTPPCRLAFYQGQQFPDEYHGDIFASEHGSWNKSVRTGYEVIRVPLHHSGKASGRIPGLPDRIRAGERSGMGPSRGRHHPRSMAHCW